MKICPICQKEAKQSMSYPDIYLCTCTGKLEDIEVLKKNNLKDPFKIVQSHSRVVRFNNTTLKDISTGSILLDYYMMPKIKKGSISLFVDTSGQRCSYLITSKMLDQEILIIDPTGNFDKFLVKNNIKQNNSYVQKESVIENVFNLIKTNDIYNAVVVLDINFLISNESLKNGKKNDSHDLKIFEQELYVLNSALKKDSHPLIFHENEKKFDQSFFRSFYTRFDDLKNHSPVVVHMNMTSRSDEIKTGLRLWCSKLSRASSILEFLIKNHI